MNPKVAYLIAVQFGIFVGTMFWLIYPRLESPEPSTAAKLQVSTVDPVTTVAPVFMPGNQHSQTVGNRADREEARPMAEQPVPVVQHQYSAAAVQQYSALAAQQYYQQIAPRRYASSGLENRSIVADARSYAEADQEPAAVSPEYVESPQTVAYAQPTEVVLYSQPQIVVFANPRRFTNRCRSTPRPSALMPNAHRRPERPRSHLSRSGVVPHRNVTAPSCRPTPGFGPRGKR